MWLGTFYQRGSHILFPLCLGDNDRLSLSSSQNSPVLVALPILPAWLLASQCFTNNNSENYREQDHCPAALLPPYTFFQNKNSESNLLCLVFFLPIIHNNCN